jgi:hypothetical protein
MALTGGVLLAALLASAQPPSQTGRPGMVNYVEGQVSVDGRAVASNQAGRLEVAPGQVLGTDDGKAEMLLTPGVFLRLQSHSALRMLSPSLTKTTVELLRGEAMVEADQVQKENNLVVLDHGANIAIKKHGVFEFNADQPMVAVYDGKAQVQEDDQAKEIGKGQQISLAQNPKLKAESFNWRREDDLYAWSKLRSEYVSEANMASAQTIVMENPWWWYGTGWYWNPWFSSWAFVPGGGFLYSPFGFGFYSPVYWRSYAPVFYRPGVGFAGRVAVAPAFRGGALGGLRSGVMGGFHGGGFGGRR